MKILILLLISNSVIASEITHNERVGLLETCVIENNSILSSSSATAICEYKSKTTKNRSCAMARGPHYAFAVDCSLFDEVYSKK